MKIIIVRPYGYAGGALVLEKLCVLLRERGFDARLFNIIDTPISTSLRKTYWLRWLLYFAKWELFHLLCHLFPNSSNYHICSWKPIIKSSSNGVKRQLFPFFSKKKTIVVYPEKIYGNFLGAQYVVRYLLYHYPYADDKNAYNPGDVFIAFRDVFNNPQINPEKHVITISFFDKNLYRRYNYGERKGNCYILRKGIGRKDLPKVFDGPIIDRFTEDQKVKTFNECERCYSYDTQTFYSSIAAVCGCLSIVILEPGKSKTDYLGPEEHPLGIAYGDSDVEIEYAKRTVSKLVESLDFIEANAKNVDLFIQILKQKFRVLFD